MHWQDMTWPEIGALDRERTVLVLPVGSVEQHGHHMPTGTDTYLATAVSDAAAALVGPSVVILPSPWYGLSAHHMHFPGSITLTAETMMAIVGDIVASVVHHGFRRIAVVNGHGGNAGVIDVLASTLGHRFYGAARVACLTYFTLARDAIAKARESRPGGMGHACEFETALMLHLHPDLVHMDRAVVHYPETGTRYLSTDLVEGSIVRSFAAFDDLSESGTFGDPGLATVDKGGRFLAMSAEALAAFLTDFATWPIPDKRP
jgi:creatinine amidohydrolase